MSEELTNTIKTMHINRAGSIPLQLRVEFISLCQSKYNYRPDMSCGNCVMKYVDKLYKEI